MEGEESIYVLVILGTASVLFFGLLTIVILIVYQRKLFLNEIMKSKFLNVMKDEQDAQRKELEAIKKELAELRSKNS